MLRVIAVALLPIAFVVAAVLFSGSGQAGYADGPLASPIAVEPTLPVPTPNPIIFTIEELPNTGGR